MIRAKIVGKLAQLSLSALRSPLSFRLVSRILSLPVIDAMDKSKRKKKKEEEEEETTWKIVVRRGQEILGEEDGRIGGRMGKRAAREGGYQMGRSAERGD